MNQVQSWGDAVASSFGQLWIQFINFIPELIGALLVLLVGWAIAATLGRATEKLVRMTKIDKTVENTEVNKKFKEEGWNISLSRIAGEIVKWFLIIVFLMAATEILNLPRITEFLNEVILYIPNVIVAIAILAIAILVGNFIYNLVQGSAEAAGIKGSHILALISKWAIVIFGILAALVQLKVAVTIVNTLFMGLVAALALSIGLAFGLGGREEAANLLKKVRENMEKK